MFEIESGVVPLFVSFIWLVTVVPKVVSAGKPVDSLPPKITGDYEREIAVASPVSSTVCGLLVSVSTIVRVPVRVPVAAGVKARFSVHELPGATFALHPPVTANSAVAVVLLIVIGEAPQLERTKPYGLLVVPTAFQRPKLTVAAAGTGQVRGVKMTGGFGV